MTGIEWFVVGGIAIAAIDQIIQQTPYKSNNIVQLLLTGLKAVFRVKGWCLALLILGKALASMQNAWGLNFLS